MCVFADEFLATYTLFSIEFILYQILRTYINSTTFEEYLRELKCAQTDGQTERKTNETQKYFFNFIENVNIFFF